MTVLSVSGLEVNIHGTEILRDVELDIGEGECFGVVGESGSGKSMTALAVLGLLPAGARRTGAATLEGIDLFGLSEPEMCRVRGRQVGMIFQEPMTALNPVKSIGDQVAETLMVHEGLTRAHSLEVAAERLERVEMPISRFPLDLFPHELSGGQRQRVCIAMAIALRPKLLIADEPTTALDVSTQSRILRLLSSLVESDGMSLMLITHDLAVIAGMAASTAVMHEGRVVERGPTKALFMRMQHPYTRKLFAASQHVPTRGEATFGTPVVEAREAVREYTKARRRLFERPEKVRAVDGVSFRLRRGESLGLVGESGCGKSSLARMVLGLDPIQNGSVLIEGTEVQSREGMPSETRMKIQAVFQDPYGSFNPRHKVERLVSEPFHLAPEAVSKSEKRDRVASSLEDVGLSADDMQKYIHEFSGGQRQRIAIARALVLRPEVIVLDEAVSALDVSIRAQILDLLSELQDRHGLAYLFISHDLTVVNAVTDRVLVMFEGRIVEEGATSEVFASPRHDYTRSLLSAAPKIPSEWIGRNDAPMAGAVN